MSMRSGRSVSVGRLAGGSVVSVSSDGSGTVVLLVGSVGSLLGPLGGLSRDGDGGESGSEFSEHYEVLFNY